MYVTWIVGVLQSVPFGLSDALNPAIRDHFWGATHEHPPFAMIVYGLCDLLFGHPRLGAIGFSVLMVVSVYLLSRYRYDRATSALAVALLFCMPRFLGHTLLCTLDAPAVAMGTLCVYFFIHGLEERRYSVCFAVCLGLATATKVNAAFLPFVLVPWGYLTHRKAVYRNAILGAAIGPLVFFACWPWLWSDPSERLAAFIGFFIQYPFDAIVYLGTTYSYPQVPWHYALVMTAVTVPLVVQGGFAAAVGMGASRWRDDRFLWLLLALSVLPIFIVIATRPTVRDGVRYFLGSYPPAAIIASAGIMKLIRLATSSLGRRRSQIGTIGLALAVVAGSCTTIIAQYPFMLSYYNPLIGGLPGAAERGMQVTYWGEAFTPALRRRLSEHLGREAHVHFLCMATVAMGDGVRVSTSDYPVRKLYEIRRLEMLPQDYRPQAGTYDAIVVNNRRGYFNPAITALYDRGDPRYRLFTDLKHDGVSLLKVFVRDDKVSP